MTFQIIRAEADDDSGADARHAEVRIYDTIGRSFWSDTVDAKTFVNELEELDVDEIDVRINSYGGDVFDGFAIYNALRRHDAKVTTHVDGIAASIASVIALAGERVVVHELGYMMIHEPWSFAMGDAAEMRRSARLLEKLGVSSAQLYASRTGRSVQEMREAMQEETWYSAEEAVEIGLAHAVEDVDADDDAAPEQRYRQAASGGDVRQLLQRYENTPERIVAALAGVDGPPASRAPRAAERAEQVPATSETDAAGKVPTTATQADARALAILLP